ncbi:MAG: hypothetical protein ACREL4_04190 [Gemmatimonadales bacterium]
MIRTVFVALLALTLGARASRAQDAQAEGSGTWFDWSPVGIVAEGDSAHGIRLWAVNATNKVVIHDDKAFSEHFTPDAMDHWLESVDQLMSVPSPAPDSIRSDIATPILEDGRGGGVRLLRVRKKHKWDASPIITFIGDSGRGGFSIKLSAAEADNLVVGLRWFSQRVRHLPPDSLPPDVVSCASGDILDSRPEVLHKTVDQFPPEYRWLRGPGKALMRFVIDTTGHVDSVTIRTIFATDPKMEGLARVLLLREAFRPGVLHGHAVKVLADQTVTFR